MVMPRGRPPKDSPAGLYQSLTVARITADVLLPIASVTWNTVAESCTGRPSDPPYPPSGGTGRLFSQVTTDWLHGLSDQSCALS